MLVLRDGEFSVWCRYCQWRSPGTPQLALVLALDHLCGGAADRSPGIGPSPPFQSRHERRTAYRVGEDMRMEHGAGCILTQTSNKS